MDTKFKPGDKVSFKNEKLNGVVTDVFKNGKIKVLLDDGFEMDVQEKELIKINDATGDLEKLYKADETVFKDEIPLAILFGKEGEVNLVTLPAEENSVLSGPVNFILENRTDYSIAFNFSFKNQLDQLGVMMEMMAPKSKAEIGKYQRSELKKWNSIHLEILFFKAGEHKPLRPVISDLSILLPELQQTQIHLKGRNAFSRLQLLYSGEEFLINAEQLKNAFMHKAKPEPGKIISADLFSYSTSKEVDLHIEALTDNYSELTNSEILEMQMITFRNSLNSAIVKKLKSITFIHGIGDGVLKRAIQAELKDYKGLKHQPAPMGKYGLGAIEIML